MRVSKNKRYGGIMKKIGAKKLRPWVYHIRGLEIPEIERVVRKYEGRIIY